MEYRRVRNSREHSTFNKADEFRASSTTPVRLLAADGLGYEHEDDAYVVIGELRREVARLEEREAEICRLYEARIRELESVHKSDVTMLLEESKRLDNALLCIRGLCDFQQTTEREDSPCADELLAAVLSEAGFSGGEDDDEEETVVHNVMLDGLTEYCDMRTHVVESMDRKEVQGEDGTEDGDVASVGLSDEREDDVIYTREDEDDLFVKDSFCQIRDFRGENPGVLTESNMDRILDQPSKFQGNAAHRSHKFKNAMDAMDARVGRAQAHAQAHAQAQSVDSVDSPASGWKIPSVHTRTRLYAEVEALEKKLRNRKLLSHGKEKIVVEGAPGDCQDDDDGDDVGGDYRAADNHLLLVDHESDDEFVRTIKALGDSSPTTANLLTQHVSDSWVQKYAKKASATKAGGGSTGLTKSSFLKRSPISLVEVFSSSTPLWKTRLTG